MGPPLLIFCSVLQRSCSFNCFGITHILSLALHEHIMFTGIRNSIWGFHNLGESHVHCDLCMIVIMYYYSCMLLGVVHIANF